MWLEFSHKCYIYFGFPFNLTIFWIGSQNFLKKWKKSGEKSKNKEDDDTELKSLKLTDFCDLESFNKSIDMPTYGKALFTLRYNGSGCSSFYLPKSIHNICKTLVIFAFFGMLVEYRKKLLSICKRIHSRLERNGIDEFWTNCY